MKQNSSLVKAFTDTNKEMCKEWIAVEPKDVYLAYCALALCTIADKMADGPYLIRGRRRMPKLNREKLSYKKKVRTVEKVRSNSFYDPIYSDDKYSKRYRGYHTYDYFGPKEETNDQLS